jgi:hypothetical protein
MFERRRMTGPFVRTVSLCAVMLTSVGCSGLFKSSDSPPTPGVPAPSLPGKVSAQRVSQYVFYSDVALAPSAPLFQELSELREQIYRGLQLPPANTVIQVYLFNDQPSYDRFMKSRYPELPRRRAFFIAQPKSVGGPEDLLVFTYWGDHIRQDLRHELTHALLHSVLKDVPLWLDEGLAEYFELPPEKNGLNVQHLDAMRKSGAYPDLAALEKLEQVHEMGRPQYQEAWAWVHFLLHGSNEGRLALLSYLQALRDPKPPGPLLPHLKVLFPSPNDMVAQHIARVDSAPATIRPVVDQRRRP